MGSLRDLGPRQQRVRQPDDVRYVQWGTEVHATLPWFPGRRSGIRAHERRHGRELVQPTHRPIGAACSKLITAVGTAPAKQGKNSEYRKRLRKLVASGSATPRRTIAPSESWDARRRREHRRSVGLGDRTSDRPASRGPGSHPCHTTVASGVTSSDRAAAARTRRPRLRPETAGPPRRTSGSPTRAGGRLAARGCGGHRACGRLVCHRGWRTEGSPQPGPLVARL